MLKRFSFVQCIFFFLLTDQLEIRAVRGLHGCWLQLTTLPPTLTAQCWDAWATLVHIWASTHLSLSLLLSLSPTLSLSRVLTLLHCLLYFFLGLQPTHTVFQSCSPGFFPPWLISIRSLVLFCFHITHTVHIVSRSLYCFLSLLPTPHPSTQLYVSHHPLFTDTIHSSQPCTTVRPVSLHSTNEIWPTSWVL